MISISLLFCSISIYAIPQHKAEWSKVEQQFLSRSQKKETYAGELIPVIQVSNRFELGKLAALRFIEWLQTHPNGVVAFTSGNTPEYFIKYLKYYKNNWQQDDVQDELKSYGIYSKKFPKSDNLKLVQTSELYPIVPNHTKKISNYTLRNYAAILGIKPHNILLIDIEQRGILSEKGIDAVFNNGTVDLTVLEKTGANRTERWQQRAIKELQSFCKEYEKKIKVWGGIDFYIGTISYNGNLEFNIPNDLFNTKTHYVSLDYSTASEISHNLGGMEYARGKLAITIGINTITAKPDAVKMILVSDENNTKSVRNAIERVKHSKYPASSLQSSKNSRFYITDGAAELLEDRRIEYLENLGTPWPDNEIIKTCIDIAKNNNKPILTLTADEINKDRFGNILLNAHQSDHNKILQHVHNILVANIENGVAYMGNKFEWTAPKKILHTSPHHDDMIFAYNPVPANFERDINHFVYFTSGYNSVTNHYLMSVINSANDWWLNKHEEWIFNRSETYLYNKFKSYYQKNYFKQIESIDIVNTVRGMVKVFDIKNMDELKSKIRWLKDIYFPNQKPGDLDSHEVILLKSILREKEAEKQLALLHSPIAKVVHLRSKFYSGHEFKRAPRQLEDVKPFEKIYIEVAPSEITLLDDPQSSIPSTNYRVLQIINTVLINNYDANKNISIIGYRSPWFRYKPHQANIFLPVSNIMLEEQKKIFNACFNTQKSTSFPSPIFDGNIAEMAKITQKMNLSELRLLLGDKFFDEHNNKRVQEAVGFTYLNKMTQKELYDSVLELSTGIELEESYLK